MFENRTGLVESPIKYLFYILKFETPFCSNPYAANAAELTSDMNKWSWEAILCSDPEALMRHQSRQSEAEDWDYAPNGLCKTDALAGLERPKGHQPCYQCESPAHFSDTNGNKGRALEGTHSFVWRNLYSTATPERGIPHIVFR